MKSVTPIDCRKCKAMVDELKALAAGKSLFKSYQGSSSAAQHPDKELPAKSG